MKHLRTTYPEQPWTGWVVLLLGAILTVCTLWLTVTNLERTVILFVLIPGAAIGTTLMVIGSLGIRVCAEINDAAEADRRKLEADYLTCFTRGISSGTAAGILLGIVFGSLAIGVMAGPLVGLTLGMATWVRARETRRVTRS